MRCCEARALSPVPSAAAGFGKAVNWEGDDAVPPGPLILERTRFLYAHAHSSARVGHKLTFKEALNHSAGHLLTGILLPRWAFALRKQWRFTLLAFDELRVRRRARLPHAPGLTPRRSCICAR